MKINHDTKNLPWRPREKLAATGFMDAYVPYRELYSFEEALALATLRDEAAAIELQEDCKIDY